MEILVALLLISGLLKSFFLYFGIDLPLDLTLLIAGFIILNLLYKSYSGKLEIPERGKMFLLALGLFVCFAGFSLIYSASNLYKFQKFSQLILLLLTGICIGITKNFNGKKFTSYFGFSSILLGVIYLLIIKIKGTDTTDLAYKEFFGLYLSISISVGLVGLLFFFGKFDYSQKLKNIVFGISIFTLLIIAARGPILIILLSIIIFKIIPLAKSKLKLVRNSIMFGISGVLTMAAVFPILYSKSEMLRRAVWRMGILFTDLSGSSEVSDSVGTRLENMKFTVETVFSNWSSFIFGKGLGSFGILLKGTDIKQHPHNIFLEIWFDLGLIGFLIFSLCVFVPLFIQHKNKVVSQIPFIALLYLALNYSKSTSFSEIRTGIAMVALTLVCCSVSKKTIQSAD